MNHDPLVTNLLVHPMPLSFCQGIYLTSKDMNGTKMTYLLNTSLNAIMPSIIIHEQWRPRLLFAKNKKINNACTWYRHECEPVIQMLNTADHVVVWGFMPLWEVGSGVLFLVPWSLGGCNGSLFIFEFSLVEDKVRKVFNGVLVYIFHEYAEKKT